ncbi:transcription factor bHLH67-like [Quillaja saponaria]|uniref:Transcription factor bHLH67-like n=1 Tax=Quillaja saponaria TaxID=32244 RepID=A0AAD7LSA9_QUISA|nr:transcription factor bHLH67-like [Quillaja saponaria]
MEGLQGPINSCFFGDHLEVNCVEQGFINTQSLRFGEEEVDFLIPSLEDKIPFLQMLQSVESPQLLPFKEPNFQALLRLQHLKKPWDGNPYMPIMETQIHALELESCVIHDMVELQSPVKSESNDLKPPHLASCVERLGSECNQEQPNSAENLSTDVNPNSRPKQTRCSKAQLVPRERRKRKRSARPTKNKEDVENQRMTHIAVERNRRRQMNDHLSVLKSLMPPSYIQKGDQASIIGGAIDFLKELEQLLQSLEAQKRMRKNEEVGPNQLFKPLTPHFEIGSSMEEPNCGEQLKAENKSDAADIEVTVIESHVNLKVQCQRKHGQLLKAIVALEDLRLTVLHLNITSTQASVLYSFNLKIEEGCKIGSANEIAEAVHHIFNFING